MIRIQASVPVGCSIFLDVILILFLYIAIEWDSWVEKLDKQMSTICRNCWTTAGNLKTPTCNYGSRNVWLSDIFTWIKNISLPGYTMFKHSLCIFHLVWKRAQQNVYERSVFCSGHCTGRNTNVWWQLALLHDMRICKIRVHIYKCDTRIIPYVKIYVSGVV